MKIRGKIAAFLLIASLFLIPLSVYAHQPNLVSQAAVEVKDPEISRAFYGVLEGSLHEYHLVSSAPFTLYLNLLTPLLPNAEKDFEVRVWKLTGSEKQTLVTINTADFPWKEYYEEFAGDNYYMGPEWEAKVDPGACLITVSTPAPYAKYVLAVGKVESFPVSEMLRTLGVLPALKMSFFEGAFFDIFNGIIRKFLLGFIIFILLIVGLVIFLIVRGSKRKRQLSNP